LIDCVVANGSEEKVPFFLQNVSFQMLKYISPETAPPSSLTARDGAGGLWGDGGDIVVSEIVVAETSVGHSGTYKCEPGAAPADEVLVHVIDGKFKKRINKLIFQQCRMQLLVYIKCNIQQQKCLPEPLPNVSLSG
jgi:hypothetical protein